MINHNPNNERIKRKYFIFLKEAKRQNEATVDAVAKALSRFEEYGKHRDFKAFHFNQAVAFKNNLAIQKKHNSDNKLSKSTLNTTLRHLKCFFEWLSMQPGYKAKINYTDAEYFNSSEKDTRIARATRPKSIPTLEQIKHVLETMPTDSDIALRNRALIAFTILTGARDNAIASLKLKHIDLIEHEVFQDAREVRTKFSKTFSTNFFPVGDNVFQIVESWINHLREDLLWGNDDPAFPSTEMILDEKQQFKVNGLKKQHWSGTSAIRKIFKEAFTNAGLTYFNPHSFRDTLVGIGLEICRTPEDFKAWSQNLGHEQVMTTFTSYGQVSEQRQSDIIQNLSLDVDRNESEADKIADALFKRIRMDKNGLLNVGE